jgi:hypothetical protein
VELEQECGGGLRAGGRAARPRSCTGDQGRIRRRGEWMVAEGQFILGRDMEEVQLMARWTLIGQEWSTCGRFRLPFSGGVRGMHTLAVGNASVFRAWRGCSSSKTKFVAVFSTYFS